MFEDTKAIKRSCKSKNDRQYNGQKKKGQTTIYKTLHRKLMITQHEPHSRHGVNSDASEALVLPVPLVTPIVLLLNDTN